MSSNIFNVLPEEVLVRIFKFLQWGEYMDEGDEDDEMWGISADSITEGQEAIRSGRITEARLVCKRFYNLAWHPMLNTSLQINAGRLRVEHDNVKDALERRPGLKELHLGPGNFIANLECAFKSCPRLRKLVVVGVGHFLLNQDFLDTCGKHGNSLEELGLVDVRGKFPDPLEVRHVLPVKKLVLDSRLGEPELTALAKHCPNLEDVTMGCYSDEVRPFLATLRNRIRALRFGKRFNDDYENDVMHIFEHDFISPSLTELEMPFDKISDYGLEMIANSCPNLTRLRIRWGTNITKHGMRELLAKLKKLEEFHLEKLVAFGRDYPRKYFFHVFGPVVTSIKKITIKPIVDFDIEDN